MKKPFLVDDAVSAGLRHALRHCHKRKLKPRGSGNSND